MIYMWQSFPAAIYTTLLVLRKYVNLQRELITLLYVSLISKNVQGSGQSVLIYDTLKPFLM